MEVKINGCPSVPEFMAEYAERQMEVSMKKRVVLMGMMMVGMMIVGIVIGLGGSVGCGGRMEGKVGEDGAGIEGVTQTPGRGEETGFYPLTGTEEDEGVCRLPVSDGEKEQAASECVFVMDAVRDIYERADKGTAANIVISRSDRELMAERIGETGEAAVVADSGDGIGNGGGMEEFLDGAGKGQRGETAVFEVHGDGGIGQKWFRFDGERMELLYTCAVWDGFVPVVNETVRMEVKDWSYTEKGWFIYELRVPEPPVVSEVVNGFEMIRVKPVEERAREIMREFLEPVGYQGHNLFSSDWDGEHLDGLDFNGLFEYMYPLKYNHAYEFSEETRGIPAPMFEGVLTEFLPVSREQLKEFAVFEEQDNCYGWAALSCGNYTPKAFDTSKPEINGISENPDGTVSLTVDAVCQILGTDRLFTHELRVRFTDDGCIRFLGNQVLMPAEVPDYQYRVR